MPRSRHVVALGTALVFGVFLVGGCSQASTGAGLEASPSPSALTSGVRTIAKDDGVPPAGVTPSFSTVLVVPDYLVDAVLADVRIERLSRLDGEPLQSGRYADFTGSDDLAPGEVLALWYSGQSGSCPSYLQELRLNAEGDVDVTQGPAAGPSPCTDDYNAYRQLVAIPEDAVPAISELPLTLKGEESNRADDLVVDIYPATPAP